MFLRNAIFAYCNVLCVLYVMCYICLLYINKSVFSKENSNECRDKLFDVINNKIFNIRYLYFQKR